ncbi:MAG: heavy metal translocating P-type ATPase [Patescibacteria group bacterium]|mgnify:CR=1 FL=1
MKLSLPIKGMHCASCASVIQKKLGKLPGVESCEVNYGNEKAQLVFDPEKITVEKMNQEIADLGYEMMDNSMHAGHDMMTPLSSDTAVREQKLLELAKLKKHVQIVIPMVVVSVLVMVWEIGAEPLKLWPEMPDMLMEFFHHLLPILATYALFVIGLPYLKGVARFVKHRVANMDTLVGIGTSVAYLYSFVVTAFEESLSTLVNTQQNYYDVTIVVIGFITLGKYLEARSKLKTGEAIEKLLGLQAKNAIVLRDGVETEVPIDSVEVGEMVLVKPGGKIPLDGVIMEGKSAIDESMITGEPMPVDKGPEDSVIGATINKYGSLKIRVSRVGEETMLSQIIRMVEEAQGSKAPIEKLADLVSGIFVPVVLVVAVITFGVWILTGNAVLGLVSFVGILVIACPCAMGLATPTAVIVGVGKAAQNGILIKNAESLEKFDGINFVVMDKTGTITKGSPEVIDILAIEKDGEKEFLKLLASLEALSEHPLAVAVVDRAKKEKLVLQKVKDFSAIEGKGLRGVIGKEEYFAGNLKLVSDLGLRTEEKIIDEMVSFGKTPVVFMTQKKILGYVGIADTIKDDAKETVDRLHKLKIKVAMLTGDNKRTAKYIADLVGIDKVIAEVLPGDKALEIKKLQEEGYRVAMVGDGINDAPALATADVGVAMGTGTDVAIESAGITLLGGHISKLPAAVKLARSTMRVIKQNLFWAFIYNIVGIPLAAFGLLNPAIAGAAMGLSSVSVVLNSLRLKSVKI